MNTVLIHTLNPGDTVNIGGEECTVLTRPLRFARDNNRVGFDVRRANGHGAAVGFDSDINRVTVIERKVTL